MDTKSDKNTIPDEEYDEEYEIIQEMLKKTGDAVRKEHQEFERRFPNYKPEPLSKETLALIKKEQKKHFKSVTLK